MDTEKTDDGEVSQHAVERAGAVLAGDRHWVFIALHDCELFVDLGALDEGVEDVEDGIAAPSVWVVAEELGFFVRRAGSGYAVAVPAEGLELVDEFIDNIPGPVVLLQKSASTVFWAKKGEELTEGTSKSTGPSEFRM